MLAKIGTNIIKIGTNLVKFNSEGFEPQLALYSIANYVNGQDGCVVVFTAKKTFSFSKMTCFSLESSTRKDSENSVFIGRLYKLNNNQTNPRECDSFGTVFDYRLTDNINGVDTGKTIDGKTIYSYEFTSDNCTITEGETYVMGLTFTTKNTTTDSNQLIYVSNITSAENDFAQASCEIGRVTNQKLIRSTPTTENKLPYILFDNVLITNYM